MVSKNTVLHHSQLSTNTTASDQTTSRVSFGPTQEQLNTVPLSYFPDIRCITISSFSLLSSVIFRKILSNKMFKTAFFWDVAPCSQVDVNERFRYAYCFHHQGNEKSVALMKEAPLDGISTLSKALCCWVRGLCAPTNS
jgi:hypothetical protein